MAAERTSASQNMKETHEELDNSLENGDDVCEMEVVEREPGYLEERFRVDRRKLEQMIQASEESGETAEHFFMKVMEETNTEISWPAKLKIGAKSKKDPHIKVSGQQEAVSAAKDRIMAILDTKSTRVTLKLDVPHTEHSHVIGKGGNNIKRVMQDTGCHIHFPDSNRNNQAEKSNQVSIAGQPSGVEEARSKIRELLPLVFMFELPVPGLLQPLPDPQSPTMQHIQNTYNVSVTFKQRPRSYATTVIIRGSVSNAKEVKEATALLIEQLTGNIGTTVPVSMQLEIAPQHHLFIIGRGGANMKQIMQRTGAQIHFPDLNSSTPQRRGTVFITGAIESVFLARQHLIGCLPLTLMFDMKEDLDIGQAGITSLMEHLDVFISIKPKPKQPSKSVIVKSIERNSSNLYNTRERLLGSIKDPLPGNSPGLMETNASSSATSYLGLSSNINQMSNHKMLSLGVNNPMFVLNATPSPMQNVSQIMTHPQVGSPLMVLAPHTGGGYPMAHMAPLSHQASSSPAPLQTHPMVTARNQQQHSERLQQQQQQMLMQQNFPSNDESNCLLHLQNQNGLNREMLLTLQNALRSQQNVQHNKYAGAFGPRSQKSSGSASPVPSLSGPPSPPIDQSNNINNSSMLQQLFFKPSMLNSDADSVKLNALLANISLQPSDQPSPPPTQGSKRVEVNCIRSLMGDLCSSSSSSSPPSSSSPLFSPPSAPYSSRQGLCRTPPGFSNSMNGSMDTGKGSPMNNPASPLIGRHAQQSLGLESFLPFQNGDAQRCDCVDPKRCIHSSSNATTSSEFDYEQKKKLATKAMQQKPSGETRLPTNQWAGLGFSKSMPDSAIRERLEANNRRYNGPTMSTTYENVGGEADCDPWKETPAAKTPDVSPSSSFCGGTMPFRVSDAPGHFPRKTVTDYNLDGRVAMNSTSSSLMESPSTEWPPKTELLDIFRKFGLERYCELFQQQEIDLPTFVTLTESDLKELGISTFGARRKMLLAIADLNVKPPSALPPSSPFTDAPRVTGVTGVTGVIGGQRRRLPCHPDHW